MRKLAISALAVMAVVACGCGGSGQTYVVPTPSMEPTYPTHTKVSYEPGGSFAVGDVVILKEPQAGVSFAACLHKATGGDGLCIDEPGAISNLRSIKRVVAGPGDDFEMTNGHVTRDRKPESGYDTRPCRDLCDSGVAIHVPQDLYYVMGDNRGTSVDSRSYGFVPKDAILGKVTGKVK
jgi:signal peptidase I